MNTRSFHPAHFLPLRRTLALGAVLFALAESGIAQTASTAKPNLLKNPAFEEGEVGWQFNAWGKKGAATVDTTEKREGKNSIRIENTAGDDSFFKQVVTVKPQTRYRLTGYIKTKGVVAKGSGAVLSLEGGYEKTESLEGNNGWKKMEFEFDSAGNAEVKVGPRLGHHHSMAMGVAWFDDLKLVEIGPSRKR